MNNKIIWSPKPNFFPEFDVVGLDPGWDLLMGMLFKHEHKEIFPILASKWFWTDWRLARAQNCFGNAKFHLDIFFSKIHFRCRPQFLNSFCPPNLGTYLGTWVPTYLHNISHTRTVSKGMLNFKRVPWLSTKGGRISVAKTWSSVVEVDDISFMKSCFSPIVKHF